MLAPVSLIQLTRVNFAVEENGTILRNPVELVLNIYIPHLKLLKKLNDVVLQLGLCTQSHWRYLDGIFMFCRLRALS